MEFFQKIGENNEFFFTICKKTRKVAHFDQKLNEKLKTQGFFYTFLTLRLSSLKRLLYELNVKLPEEDARVTDSKSKLKSFLLKNASGVASGDEPSGTRIRKVEIFTIYFSCKSKL